MISRDFAGLFDIFEIHLPDGLAAAEGGIARVRRKTLVAVLLIDLFPFHLMIWANIECLDR